MVEKDLYVILREQIVADESAGIKVQIELLPNRDESVWLPVIRVFDDRSPRRRADIFFSENGRISGTSSVATGRDPAEPYWNCGPELLFTDRPCRLSIYQQVAKEFVADISSDQEIVVAISCGCLPNGALCLRFGLDGIGRAFGYMIKGVVEWHPAVATLKNKL